ncbi:MAG: hypothetical protein K2H13_10420, partial [Eubacterium sp.]|nr:hypothetical protein [Eubacterium sp.]
EEIDVAKFVCAELDKFDSDLFRHEVKVYETIYAQGLDGIAKIDLRQAHIERAAAKSLPKNTDEEKEFRKFEIELAKNKISAKKAYDKYYGSMNEFVEPDMTALTALFDKEDAIDEQIFELTEEMTVAKRAGEKELAAELKAKIKAAASEKKDVQKQAKALMDEFAKFNRAAKPFNEAKKLLIQQENYSHFDEIAALYEEAKEKAAEEDRIKEEEAARKREEEAAELARRKAEKAAKKNK